MSRNFNVQISSSSLYLIVVSVLIRMIIRMTMILRQLINMMIPIVVVMKKTTMTNSSITTMIHLHRLRIVMMILHHQLQHKILRY